MSSKTPGNSACISKSLNSKSKLRLYQQISVLKFIQKNYQSKINPKTNSKTIDFTGGSFRWHK